MLRAAIEAAARGGGEMILLTYPTPDAPPAILQGLVRVAEDAVDIHSPDRDRRVSWSTIQSARPAGLELVDLRAYYDGELLDRVYTTLLEGAFPGDEFESQPDLAEQLTRADGGVEVTALVAVEAVGRPVGVIVVEWYPESSTLLLGYLAVHPDDRGRGLGSWLMHEAVLRWYGRSGCRLVLGELEDPRLVPGPNGQRRLDFHARAGAQVLAAPYFQPRLRPDAERVPMLLAVFSSAPEVRRKGRIAPAAVKAFLREYVLVTEGAEGLASAAVTWMLSHYDGDSIPLLPLSRYRDVPSGKAPPE